MVLEKNREGGGTGKEAPATAMATAAVTEEAEEGEIVENPNLSETEEGPRRLRQSHPLEHSWTFWFDNPSAKSKQAAWGSSIRPVHTFSTVEGDFSRFKYKIEPKWEDPVCANGGKWTISYSRGKVDTWWLYTLAILGEQFDHGEEICGAVVNVRAKQEKISIWMKNGLNEAAQS
ncbi:eukaryotic translation initiation factor 4E-1-like [Phoenix dactylifera]|uniref:eIF-4F 25 kDa subunit n=1 Tax=Phoenix dactylifera TaxID=42345 RepID=A0A8B8J6Y5_PHODC|nr:eukaryotic translation initiation factor 4E-1-like [Phoenix dactylifera]